MCSSIIIIGLACTIGGLAVPVAFSTDKILEHRGLQERGESLILSSNAVTPELGEYFKEFFSGLTPSGLTSLLQSNSWAEEKRYEFQPEPDPGTRTRGYQELYNEFLASRNSPQRS